MPGDMEDIPATWETMVGNKISDTGDPATRETLGLSDMRPNCGITAGDENGLRVCEPNHGYAWASIAA